MIKFFHIPLCWYSIRLIPPQFEVLFDDPLSSKVLKIPYLLLTLKTVFAEGLIGFPLKLALTLEIPVSQSYNISFKYIIFL